MKKEYTGKLVKIFIEGNEKYKHKPLYEAIIDALKEAGISGATIMRGIEGFGEDKQIHEDFLEVLSRKLPILIDVVVKDENLDKMIEVISPMMKTGKICITNDVTVLAFEE